MQHGGIQDESSKHEQQKVYKLSLSQTANAELLRPLSKTNAALRQRLRKHGLLTMTRRRQLDRTLCQVYNNTASMTQALRSAEESQLCHPSFIKKLAAVKDNLEVVAAEAKMYKEKNKEHGTQQLLKHVLAELSDACKQFAYLRKLLQLERAKT